MTASEKMHSPELPYLRTTISNVVIELHNLRETSLENRQRLNNPPKLPSRKALADIIDKLSAALFPNRLPGSTRPDW